MPFIGHSLNQSLIYYCVLNGNKLEDPYIKGELGRWLNMVPNVFLYLFLYKNIHLDPNFAQIMHLRGRARTNARARLRAYI